MIHQIAAFFNLHRSHFTVVAFNLRPAFTFAFELYDLAWSKARKADWIVTKTLP